MYALTIQFLGAEVRPAFGEGFLLQGWSAGPLAPWSLFIDWGHCCKSQRGSILFGREADTVTVTKMLSWVGWEKKNPLSIIAIILEAFVVGGGGGNPPNKVCLIKTT